MKKFVIGDIHGHHLALNQVLAKSGFNFENDLLISLGDLVDLGPDSPSVIETMMKVKNFRHILGNHDKWCLNWMRFGTIDDIWLNQGGQKTIQSYENHKNLIESHLTFLEQAVLYYRDENNRLFVHGGFAWDIPFDQQINDEHVLIWDRSLALMSYNFELQGKKLGLFSEIYLGHTPTRHFGQLTPIKHSNIWLMDTGCGRGGKLTIMDIETKRYWQSDES
ncbi:MAG: metallophosphoesterase [Bacteroidales bacterium]|nr:metallophosphoesterase [Bacteroidales bacterium]